jgi:hypothetical protein
MSGIYYRYAVGKVHGLITLLDAGLIVLWLR